MTPTHFTAVPSWPREVATGYGYQTTSSKTCLFSKQG